MQHDNILNVKIPPELRQRIPTGIGWLDSLLTFEGGMVPSLVYMVSGTPGAGKSTLMRQIADGLTGSDNVVLYNSGEESKEQIAIAAEKMGLKHGFIYDSITSHTQLIARLERLRAENPGKRVILIQDSVQKLTATSTSAKAFDTLKDWAKATFMPIIVIFQVTKAGKFKGDNSSLHDADVQIEMVVNKKTRARTITVSKNRFGPVTDDDVFYTITQQGLQLESNPDDIFDDEESDDEVVTDVMELAVGLTVRCNKRAHRNHRGKTGKVAKVGRTRVTVRTFKGEELYLPIEHVSIEVEDDAEADEEADEAAA